MLSMYRTWWWRSTRANLGRSECPRPKHNIRSKSKFCEAIPVVALSNIVGRAAHCVASRSDARKMRISNSEKRIEKDL